MKDVFLFFRNGCEKENVVIQYNGKLLGHVTPGSA